MAVNSEVASGHGKSASRSAQLSTSIVAGITGLLDCAIVVGSGLLIFAIHVLPIEPDRLPQYVGVIALYCLLLVLVFSVSNLYSFRYIANPILGLKVLSLIGVSIFLILVGTAFALKISEEFSRAWAFSWLLSMLMLLVLSRLIVAHFLKRLGRNGKLVRNIVIYGSSAEMCQLIAHIESMQEPWNRIIGFFDDRTKPRSETQFAYPHLGDLEKLVEWSRENRADEVLVAMPWNANDRLMEISRMLSVIPVDVRLIPHWTTTPQGRLDVQYDMPMLNILEKPISGWSALTKNMLDFLLGTTFLILSMPLMLIVALAIKLESTGPVFFRQMRYGFNNRLIKVYKFRTMYAERTDPDADLLTQRNDPRVTRVGSFLRRFSIDELPQLLNVVLGDMSIVGPRPHALKAKAGGALYEDVVDQYAVRHKVKPGITGWAQVNGWRGSTETEEDLRGRIQYDLYYIDNFSVLFDLVIILRTILVVLRGEKSY